MASVGGNSPKVLILAASRGDGLFTLNLLNEFHLEGEICDDFETLISKIGDDAGVVVLAKEVLSGASVRDLARVLKAQAKWSSLPIILLLSSGDLSSSDALEFLAPLPNLTLLERPIRQRALLSVIQSAMADRMRQFELRDSLNNAIEANRAKSEFLANMSHEIRTPLGAVLGFSELLADEKLNENDRKVYLNAVQRNGNLLTALIDDILDLAKVEAGALAIEWLQVSVDDFMGETISALLPRAKSKGISLSLELQPDLPPYIITDPVRLKQILLNVIGNAIKFTRDGYVKVEVSRSRERDVLCVRVRDTGIGIKPDHVDVLFKPFSQADSSITRRFGGTGLGLALSQRLAQALEGDLRLLESKFGVGSVFELTLKCKEAPAPATTSDQGRATPIQFPELRGLRVLIVDDSNDNRVLLSRMLKLVGVEVSTAINGKEAVEKALVSEPDMILMDIQMPVLSGIDATASLRKEGYLKPIVALTAHAISGDREQCLAAGCTEYLTKPVSLPELVSSFVRLMEQVRMPRLLIIENGFHFESEVFLGSRMEHRPWGVPYAFGYFFPKLHRKR